MEVPLSDQDEDNEDWISSTALDFLPDSFLSFHQFETFDLSMVPNPQGGAAPFPETTFHAFQQPDNSYDFADTAILDQSLFTGNYSENWPL